MNKHPLIKGLVAAALMLALAETSAMQLDNVSWYSKQEKYEGFPLFLRYPVGINAAALKPLFPRLLIITHKLREVQPSGLPEADYNESLEAFDIALVEYFSSKDQGVAVLVETFGGQRNYYQYVSPEADIAKAQAHFAQAFPKEPLEWHTKKDENWHFLESYKADFSLEAPQSEWPNDADGDVFRELKKLGFEFDQEHDVEFNVDFDSWPPAEHALKALKSEFPNIEVVAAEDKTDHYLVITLHHRLTYAWVVKIQQDVTRLVKDFGGRCESWGLLAQ